MPATASSLEAVISPCGRAFYRERDLFAERTFSLCLERSNMATNAVSFPFSAD